jgi:4-diphosphocytidyl-2C-methyl-D-erythritol kinase
MSGSGSSVFIKVKDDAEARLIDKDKGKPKNIKSFIVKGLSAHPFNYC